MPTTRSLTLSFFRRLVDAIGAAGAWMLAYFIRFEVMAGQPGLFEEFLGFSALMAVLVVFYTTSNHLYETNRYFPWYREFLLVLKSQGQAVATFVIIVYFFWPARLSRIAILLYFTFAVVLSIILRGSMRGVLFGLRARGKNLRHVIIAGHGEHLREYLEALVGNLEKGVKISGWVDSGGLAAEYGVSELGLKDLILEGPDRPDAIIVGYNADQQRHLEKTVNVFNKTFIPVFVVPDLEHAFIGYTIEEFHGVPMIAVNSPRLNMFQGALKRALDVIGSLIGLIILSPLFLVVSLAVRLTSRGPVFYGQERMSLDGQTFTMWKFRSMKVDAEDQSGAKWANPDDDRKTKIGTLIRKTSLDEIPQFWNVLIGQMSLVGPRPERPVFIEKFKDEIPAYMLRHRMKAGITGWAQVNGWRGDTDLRKRIEFDLYYIRNWSLLLDFKILLLTFIKGFVNKNAY